jgi:hypothetical protein
MLRNLSYQQQKTLLDNKDASDFSEGFRKNDLEQLRT